MPEQSLEAVLTLKKKPIPVEDEEDSDRKALLTISCIAAIKPDLHEDKVIASLTKAFSEEHPEYYHDKCVDTTALSDVLNATEVQKVHEWEAKQQYTKEKKKNVKATQARNCPKYFKKPILQSYTAATKKGPRWLPKRDERNTTAITKLIRD